MSPVGLYGAVTVQSQIPGLDPSHKAASRDSPEDMSLHITLLIRHGEGVDLRDTQCVSHRVGGARGAISPCSAHRQVCGHSGGHTGGSPCSSGSSRRGHTGPPPSACSCVHCSTGWYTPAWGEEDTTTVSEPVPPTLLPPAPSPPITALLFSPS